MRLGVRGRFLAVSATILVTCGIGSATVLEAELRRGLEQRVQDRLRAHASAAREALRTSAREHTPDVAVIDVQMPRWDGIETLKAFRSHASLEHEKIIMIM